MLKRRGIRGWYSARERETWRQQINFDIRRVNLHAGKKLYDDEIWCMRRRNEKPRRQLDVHRDKRRIFEDKRNSGERVKANLFHKPSRSQSGLWTKRGVRGHSDSCSVCGRATHAAVQRSSLLDNQPQATRRRAHWGEAVQPKFTTVIYKSGACHGDRQHLKTINSYRPETLTR